MTSDNLRQDLSLTLDGQVSNLVQDVVAPGGLVAGMTDTRRDFSLTGLTDLDYRWGLSCFLGCGDQCVPPPGAPEADAVVRGAACLHCWASQLGVVCFGEWTQVRILRVGMVQFILYINVVQNIRKL